VHERQAGVGAREAGILRHSALEQSAREGVVAAIEAKHVVQAQMVGRPRIEVFRRHEARGTRLVQGNLQLEGSDESRQNHATRVVDIRKVGHEAIAPDHARAPRVDQLHRHSEGRPGDLDRPGEAIAHAQKRADYREIRRRRAKSKRRPSRDDEEPAQPRQLGDQLVGQRVGDRRVRSCPADQAKRQYRNRGSPVSFAPGRATSTVVVRHSAAASVTSATNRKPRP